MQLLPQRGAVEQLHDGEGDVVLNPDIEDAEDVRMRERGDRLRLALESRARGRIDGKRGRQNLEGDVAMQFRVTRAIDLPMPPAPMAPRISYGPRCVPGVRPNVRSV